MIAATLDSENYRLLAGPSISTRGLIYVKEYGELLEDAEHYAQRVLMQTGKKTLKDELAVKKLLREKMRSFIMERTGRSPVIISIIMYV